MRKKIISWMSLVTVFMTLLWSCQQELLHSEQEYDSQLQKTTVERLLREELDKKHPQVIKKLNQLSLKKSSVNGRIYTDTENDFSINTDEAYFVQDAKGTKTYTFKVERDAEKEEGSLENLILKDIGEDNFFAFFIKYDATALSNSREKPLSPEELTHHISLYSVGKKTSSEIFGKLDSCPMVFYPVGTYVYVSGTKCVEGLHDYGEPCAYLGTSNAATQGGYQVVYTITVQETSGNCNGGGFDPSSGSGTIGTTPTHGGGGSIGMPDVHDPCEKTKSFLDKPEVQNKLDELKQQAQLPAVNTLGGEKGFKVKTDGTIEDAGWTDKHKVDYGDLSASYASYHNHTLRGIHMLSHKDLDILLALTKHNSVTGPSNAMHGMIAAEEDGNGGYTYLNYVVRFNGTYQDAIGFNFTDDELDEIGKKYEKAIDELLTDPTNSDDNGFTLNKEGLQKLFFAAAKLMGMQNNVILYRIDDDGVKEIGVNSDGSTTPYPCS